MGLSSSLATKQDQPKGVNIMTVKALDAFMVVGYTKTEKLKIVRMQREEPFATAREAQHWIDANEPIGSNERWFVVQALDTDRV